MTLLRQPRFRSNAVRGPPALRVVKLLQVPTLGLRAGTRRRNVKLMCQKGAKHLRQCETFPLRLSFHVRSRVPLRGVR